MSRNLGYVPFGRNSKWLTKTCVRHLHSATINVLRSDPEQSDTAVGYALLDYFEPERLKIFDPALIQVSWGKLRVLDGKKMQDLYLHEAHVPYQGTNNLWRLAGHGQAEFQTKVLYSDTKARLRMVREDRDTEAFREIVIRDLALARSVTARQDSAIGLFREALRIDVEYFLNHNSIDAHRREARELNERSERISRHL